MDKKIKPYRRLPSNPPGPKFQCCTKLYMVSSALRFDIFVHRPQTRSPKATLKFGVAGATTIQQGFDFIVHLRSGDGDGALHTSSFVSSHEGRFGLSSAQIPVLSHYLIPNLFPLLLPIPITKFRLPLFLQSKWVCSVHAFKNIGEKIFSSLANAWATWENTGNRN